MNDIGELRQFIGVHARAQAIAPRRCAEVLGRIRTDEEGAPDSWAACWSREAAASSRARRHLEASRLFNIARFPYVDGPARREALESCISSFETWRRDHPAIERLDVTLPSGRVRCWTIGLDRVPRRPLLLAIGGIVSIKEQWAPALLQIARLGMAGVVAEMPGVGENTIPYGPESWRMIGGILDAVADRASVTQTYAMALSFSGHLALRAATEDTRIRGIVTAGAPVHDFFTDTDWQRRVPRVTTDTMAHLAGVEPGRLGTEISGWALSPARLAALDIPVSYVVSRRDEIIPPADARLLRDHVRRTDHVENDDVHGSPGHLPETRLWMVESILRMRGTHRVQRAALGSLGRLIRARRRLVGATR
ncbi:alpha/beta hydrolase [Actinoplanes sp. NPDC026619]|uniref:alpha/beta hydrolase n=1 Tax=Actinoplanes sp. NPDC026619 TaxID=3155798 RepID=UPI0033ED8927